VDVVVGESHPGSLGSDIDIVGRCLRCRGRQVVPWPQSRPCPKCGRRMNKLDTGRVCFWD
jgi:Zn finger protein HypA/HybF involved in hydrogenase expression